LLRGKAFCGERRTAAGDAADAGALMTAGASAGGAAAAAGATCLGGLSPFSAAALLSGAPPASRTAARRLVLVVDDLGACTAPVARAARRVRRACDRASQKVRAASRQKTPPPRTLCCAAHFLATPARRARGCLRSARR
jgi:hypothetical protein